jgi:hypothetical protein
MCAVVKKKEIRCGATNVANSIQIVVISATVALIKMNAFSSAL